MAAPTILGSQFYQGLSASGTLNLALPTATSGDGYLLFFATNNGVKANVARSDNLGPWLQTLENNNFPSGAGAGSATLQLSYWDCPFISFPLMPADSGTDSGDTLRLDLSGTTDSWCAAVLIVSGMAFTGGLNYPCDICIDRGTVSGNCIFSGSNTAHSVNLNWSTNTWDTLNLAVIMSDNGSLGGQVPTGFTSVGGTHIFGTNYLQLNVGQKSTTGNNVGSASFAWQQDVNMLAVEMSLTSDIGTGTVGGNPSDPSQVNVHGRLPRRSRFLNGAII